MFSIERYACLQSLGLITQHKDWHDVVVSIWEYVQCGFLIFNINVEDGVYEVLVKPDKTEVKIKFYASQENQQAKG